MATGIEGKATVDKWADSWVDRSENWHLVRNGAAAVGIKIEVRKAKVRGLGEVFLSRDLEGEGSRKRWEGGEKIEKEEVAEIRGWGGPGCTAG